MSATPARPYNTHTPSGCLERRFFFFFLCSQTSLTDTCIVVLLSLFHIRACIISQNFSSRLFRQTHRVVNAYIMCSRSDGEEEKGKPRTNHKNEQEERNLPVVVRRPVIKNYHLSSSQLQTLKYIKISPTRRRVLHGCVHMCVVKWQSFGIKQDG